MTKAEKFWDRMAGSYETQPGDEDRAVIEKIKPYLTTDSVVLDYACATGFVAHELADDVKAVHGIDISSRMIEVAEATAADHKLVNTTFTHTTIFDAPFDPETFDMILAFNILHLVEEPTSVIQRIHDLLKPGGLFVSKTPCLGERVGFMNAVQVFLRLLQLVPHVNMPQISKLEGIITAGGFEIVEAQSLSDRPPFDHLVIARKEAK